jgi:hypothetical protein
LVHKIEASIDFFIHFFKMCIHLNGDFRVLPIVLIKMAFIQYTFGIGSMHKAIEEIEKQGI